jgi:hypothetical protein
MARRGDVDDQPRQKGVLHIETPGAGLQRPNFRVGQIDACHYHSPFMVL